MGCPCFKQKNRQQQVKSGKSGISERQVNQQNQYINTNQIRIQGRKHQKNIPQPQKNYLQCLYPVENLDYCDIIKLKNEKDVDQTQYYVLSKFTIYFGQFNIETCKKEGKGLILQRQFDKNFNSSYFHYEGQFMDDQIVGSGKLFNQKSKIIRQEGDWLSISKTLNRYAEIAIKPSNGFIKIIEDKKENSEQMNYNQQRIFLLDEKTTFYDQQLTQQDLNILQGKQWLNSSIIDAYIECLNYEDENLYWALDKENRKQYQRLKIIPSWLFSWFHQGQDEQNLMHFKEIYSQFEPIEFRIWEIYRKIGFVINEQNRHWYFVQLDFEKMEILIKDSIRNSRRNYVSTINILQNLFYLIDNAIYLKIRQCLECEQQYNTYECGAHTCMNAQALAEGKSEQINNTKDMRKFLLKLMQFK